MYAYISSYAYTRCAMECLKVTSLHWVIVEWLFQSNDLSAIHQSLFVLALWSLNCLLYTLPVAIVHVLHIQQQYWGKYMYLINSLK